MKTVKLENALIAAYAAQEFPTPGQKVQVVDAFSSALLLVLLGLLVIAAVPAIFLLYRRFLRALGRGTPRTSAGGKAGSAEALEKKGDLLAAAQAYEQSGRAAKAALLYELGRDIVRAAELYESMGQPDRAAQLHLRSGSAARAAELYMKMGNYMEAARIFRNKGDHLRAAQALETNGNQVAAAQEYTEAGQYVRAAKLFREAGFHDEAVRAYRLSLGGDGLTRENLERQYTLAAYLLLAGDRAGALSICSRILSVDPGHARAKEKLRELGAGVGPPAAEVLQGPPRPEAEAVAGAPPPASRELERALNMEIAEREGAEEITSVGEAVTLRRMLFNTRLEPRYGMRLWIQMMKALGERHRAQAYFECISPEEVVIDMRNNVGFTPTGCPDPVYTAPEVRLGASPDAASDIYCMGLILYEMVAGSLEGMASRRPSELNEAVPEWLDDLILKCIAPDREARFKSLADVHNAIVRLKTSL